MNTKTAQHTPGHLAVAHMAECRHQRHAVAVNQHKLWRLFVATGQGWHPEAVAARQAMRAGLKAARFYRKGQKHYAAAIAKAEGRAS